MHGFGLNAVRRRAPQLWKSGDPPGSTNGSDPLLRRLCLDLWFGAAWPDDETPAVEVIDQHI